MIWRARRRLSSSSLRMIENLEPGQPVNLQLEDGVGLVGVEREALHDLLRRVGLPLRLPDNLQDLVERIEHLLEALEDVDALPDGLQFVLEPLGDDLEPEMKEVPENRMQVEPFRAADLGILGRDEAGQIDDEAGLERRVLEEIRHHHLLVGVLLQLERDAHVVGRDVLHIEKRRETPAGGDITNSLDERRLVDRVGHAGDVNRLSRTRRRPLLPRRSQPDRSGAGFVDFFDLLRRVEHLGAGGKIGALHVAAELDAAQIRVVEQFHERRADFVEVVRRDVGRHADGNARRPVDQQVGHARRQHDRLGLGAVVVRTERYCGLVNLGQQLIAQSGQSALGVSHRRGAVAIERAEVAGAIDERIAKREGLRHANQRLVERGVAVRVVVAHHVADDLRALAVLDVGGQVLLPHRVKDAALHRLQSVPDVGKRA